MFLIDDLLPGPVKGLVAICRRMQRTARGQRDDHEQTLVTNLAELRRQLEACKISQQTFDAEENRVLERLEELQDLLDTMEK